MRISAHSEIATPPVMFCPIPLPLEAVARPEEKGPSLPENTYQTKVRISLYIPLTLVYYFSFG